ncbi:unnamed protein product [Amoebophrya sp. A120]|nr:unnamed protein product [Amoebophrya sp. A120]|eukprot:GSA120T00004697001.1
MELIGVAMGSTQVLFLVVMFLVKPDWSEVARGLVETHFEDAGWVKLLAANIGAVIMPWMLFYQQSACCERKMTQSDMLYARLDTVVGATIAQAVMISMVIAMGATLFKQKPQELQDVPQMVNALAPSMGLVWAKVLVALGATGASLVAALVVAVTPAWSICELLGKERSHDRPYGESMYFYIAFAAVLVAAFVITVAPGVGNTAWLLIQVEVLNALLMPVVVGFLFFLAIKKNVLPDRYRLKGFYCVLLAVVFGLCSVLCVAAPFLQ